MIKNGLYSQDADSAFILGNEAICRALVESGIQFASCYPGTPTSEILPILSQFSTLYSDLRLYTEWSTNEAVALEAAASAAQTGIRSTFTAKHVGLNVAMDAYMTLSYSGVTGGLVIIIGDDPSLHSSQNEQDTRYFAKAGKVPILEPSTPQEAYEFTRAAFDFSEKYKTPIILRITTRVAHARQIVTFGDIRPQPREAKFNKDLQRLVNVPAFAKKNHIKLIEKIQKITEDLEITPFNKTIGKLPSEFGIITSGISFTYVQEAIQLLGITDIPVLKIGLSYPLNERPICDFLSNVKTTLVIEEVESILEEDIKVIAFSNQLTTKIVGKREGFTPNFGELDTKIVILAMQEILNISKFSFENQKKSIDQSLLPNRPPVLCAGCPHRSSFLNIKKSLGKSKNDAIFVSDIGCYALGLAPPANVADLLLCMGASIGMGTGLAHSNINRPIVSIIGDSTFWHSGLPGLANAVYNNSNITVFVVDNKTTAMTGMQEHPGTGITSSGDETSKLSIEKVTEAMGVPTITVDPWDVENAQKQMSDHIKQHPNGPKVIISRRDCITDALRRKIEYQSFSIDEDTCVGCSICVNQLGCPAIHYEESNLDEKNPIPKIDGSICSGCSVCMQVCPKDAIHGVQITYEEK